MYMYGSLLSYVYVLLILSSMILLWSFRLLEIKEEDGHAIISYGDVTSLQKDPYDSDEFESSFGDPVMDAKFGTFVFMFKPDNVFERAIMPSYVYVTLDRLYFPVKFHMN